MYDKELREVRDKLESMEQQRMEEGDRTKDLHMQLATAAGEIKFLERDLKEIEIKVSGSVWFKRCLDLIQRYILYNLQIYPEIRFSRGSLKIT